eukprot:s1541_g5.t1
MSSLDDLVASENEKKKQLASERASKPRLIADPSISARDLMGVLRSFMNQKESNDIHALIRSPGARPLSWKSGPDHEWLPKLCNLVFEVLKVAPNTKLGQKKLGEALKKLLEGGDMINSSGRDDKTFLDACNQTIRIALAQFRTLKQDVTKRDMLLKLQLPLNFDDHNSDEDTEVPCFNLKVSKDESSSSLAIVPYDPPRSKRSDSPSSFVDMEAFTKVLEHEEPPLPAPCTPPSSSTITKEMIGMSSGEERDRKRSTQAGVGMRLSRSPMDVGSSPPPAPKKAKVKVQLTPKKSESDLKAEATSGLACDDHEILAEAMGHVPTVASEVKKRPAMKRPSAAIHDHVAAAAADDDSDKKVMKRPASADTPAKDDKAEIKMERKNIHSRAYNKKKTACLKAGMSHEEALAHAREAGAQAVADAIASGILQDPNEPSATADAESRGVDID